MLLYDRLLEKDWPLYAKIRALSPEFYDLAEEERQFCMITCDCSTEDETLIENIVEAPCNCDTVREIIRLLEEENPKLKGKYGCSNCEYV
jgi:hypothetical protein